MGTNQHAAAWVLSLLEDESSCLPGVSFQD